MTRPAVTGDGGRGRVERWYIGRYSTREEAERVSATYGDSRYPNRTVEPQQVGGRVDWLIFFDREATDG